MNVNELIEKLQQLNPELPVYCADGDGGYSDVTGISNGKFTRDTNTNEYAGPHDLSINGEPGILIG